MYCAPYISELYNTAFVQHSRQDRDWRREITQQPVMMFPFQERNGLVSIYIYIYIYILYISIYNLWG